MKNHYFLTVLIFFTILFISTITPAQNMKTIKIKQIEKRIDSLFFDFQKNNSYSASIAVIKNGKIIFKKSYGYANLEENVLAKPNTNYRLASVTKQFTAMCIMILKERGLLNYNQNLTDIFPDFPKYGAKITIRQLLNHISGLIDYEDLIPPDQKEQLKDIDVLNTMKKLDSTYFEPGTKYSYSNSGYALLAMIVEKISGIKFAKFLEKNIFIPLKMKNTVAYESGISEIKNRAYGYTRDENGKIERTDQSLTSAVLGDGGIYSSVEDYYKWDQALYSTKLIRKATLSEALTNGKFNDAQPINPGYGFGWMVRSTGKLKYFEHSGSTRGFSNHVIRIPELKLTVVALTNRNGYPEIADCVNKVAEFYSGFSFPVIK